MRFLTQTVATQPEQRSQGDALCAQLKEMDFQSPAHLMTTLKTHSEKNRLGWVISQVTGTVNVGTDKGLIVRIRSIN